MTHPAIKSIAFAPTGKTAADLEAIRERRAEIRLAEVRMEDEGDNLTIGPVWAGVDRPYTGGICVANTPSGRKLAQRLKKAIEAGVAFRGLAISTDIGGNTYVATDRRVIGRTLNADLRRLGF